MRERVLSKSCDRSKQPRLSAFVLTLAYVTGCMVKARDLSKAGGYMDFENGSAFAAEKVSNMVKEMTDKGVFEDAKDWDKYP
ncbi:hypothetical protein V6N13_146407 [Hibiscus sabdariffa]|uniref:Uncharacterized protein n=1 Tax=Hibiscus sabdariffa TaxID=183260 RepID=A0ABR2TSJ7_9ROSI